MDQRGLFGTADVSPHFQSVESTPPPSPTNLRLEALQAVVLKHCPVYNLIKDSGAEVRLHWEIGNGERRG